MKEDTFDYSKLDEGVREVVRHLRAKGFNTTDSGDGTKAATMECAVPFPMVAATCLPFDLIVESNRMQVCLDEKWSDTWKVEGSYAPQEGVAILLATAEPK